MALSSRTKKGKVATQKKAPVQEPEAVEPEVMDPEPTPEPAETKEVAKTQAAPPPATIGQFKTAMDEFDNAFPGENPPDAFTFPSVVAKEGQFMCDDESLGKELLISMLSYNNLFMLVPNNPKAEGSECGYSWDNEVLNNGSGMTVEEKLRDMRQDWPDASVKRYLEVHCILDDAEEDHEQLGEIVTLKLSPQSVKNFERFGLGATIKIKQGKMDPEDVKQLKVVAKTKTFNKNSFTTFNFSPAAG